MNSLLIFRLAVLSLFLGRGWLYLFWSAPLRTFLWSETYLKDFVEGTLGIEWNTYVTSPAVDIAINLFIQGIGVSFIILFALSFYLKPKHKQLSKTLIFGAVIMFLLVFLKFADKFFYIGMLIEHAIQVGTPVIFYLALRGTMSRAKFLIFAKSLIALTFVGHALFAVGFHPVPGNFIDMIISILGVSEDTAIELLLVAGSIDIVASIFLFFRETEKYALFFMIFWGTATAFARILANFNMDLAVASGLQWIPETITRFPHALIPLGLYYYLKQNISKEKNRPAQ